MNRIIRKCEKEIKRLEKNKKEKICETIVKDFNERYKMAKTLDNKKKAVRELKKLKEDIVTFLNNSNACKGIRYQIEQLKKNCKRKIRDIETNDERLCRLKCDDFEKRADKAISSIGKTNKKKLREIINKIGELLSKHRCPDYLKSRLDKVLEKCEEHLHDLW